MTDKIVQSQTNQPHEGKGIRTEAMTHAVELARQELQERGYTDEQIDLLLNRRTIRDDLTREAK